MPTLRLRPHHLLDIVMNYRFDTDPAYAPAPGENGVRTIARAIGRDLDATAEFVVGPDSICEPCSHLQADGRCDRILEKHTPPQPMDEYNDPLDRGILACLGLAPHSVMTVREFLVRVNERLPNIVVACTHPGQKAEDRHNGLTHGLATLGIRREG